MSNGHLSSILKILALYHLVTSECEPFQMLELIPKNIKWAHDVMVQIPPNDFSLSQKG